MYSRKDCTEGRQLMQCRKRVIRSQTYRYTMAVTGSIGFSSYSPTEDASKIWGSSAWPLPKTE